MSIVKKFEEFSPSLPLIHRWIPSGSPDEDAAKRALLLLVHGRGGRLSLMEFLSKRGKLSSFDILLIQAPHSDFVPEMKVPGFSWYYFKSPGEADTQSLNESRDKIRSLLQSLENFGYRRDRIFWMGFSQGGVMGVDTALRADRPLGGVVCASGFVLNPQNYPKSLGSGASDTPIFVSLGSRDEIVPPGPAEEGFSYLKTLGVPVKIRHYDRPHSFHLNSEVPEIEDWLIEKL